ncbi:hypothetical protein [Endozoicomonas sp. SCSIO W0465]|uniref:hypothetical protein n=1 Tax=Endozoicomonas sp. SCSIO W0465 TaxID=2918516 RepID=UPI002075A92B|nr:hypothetical protein [Endozoicomonas sp. SCSIO W0465]USE37439.1 hypothetical protein MJO57_04235 [Endozoicomonas sp. SCSIO W0465]
MLANIVEKWCLRGWYKNQKIPDLCGGAEQLPFINGFLIQQANTLGISVSSHNQLMDQLGIAGIR